MRDKTVVVGGGAFSPRDRDRGRVVAWWVLLEWEAGKAG